MENTINYWNRSKLARRVNPAGKRVRRKRRRHYRGAAT